MLYILLLDMIQTAKICESGYCMPVEYVPKYTWLEIHRIMSTVWISTSNLMPKKVKKYFIANKEDIINTLSMHVFIDSNPSIEASEPLYCCYRYTRILEELRKFFNEFFATNNFSKGVLNEFAKEHIDVNIVNRMNFIVVNILQYDSRRYKKLQKDESNLTSTTGMPDLELITQGMSTTEHSDAIPKELITNEDLNNVYTVKNSNATSPINSLITNDYSSISIEQQAEPTVVYNFTSSEIVEGITAEELIPIKEGQSKAPVWKKKKKTKIKLIRSMNSTSESPTVESYNTRSALPKTRLSENSTSLNFLASSLHSAIPTLPVENIPSSNTSLLSNVSTTPSSIFSKTSDPINLIILCAIVAFIGLILGIFFHFKYKSHNKYSNKCTIPFYN